MYHWFQTHTDLTPGQQTDALKAVIAGIGDFALWTFIALAVILTVIGIIVNVKFRDKFSAFLKIAVAVTVGFAVALVGVFLYFQITRLSMKGEIGPNFWLWVGFAALVVISVTVCALIKVFNGKYFKPFATGSAALCFAYVIVLLCMYPTELEVQGSKALYIILAVLLVAAIITLAFVFDGKSAKSNDTRSLTYAGICIAISYALSYIKIFDGPQGGAVTLASMLPIMIYSYIFGTKKGVLTGAVYGVLQCLQDPQFYEPLQILLDYPIAFSALGLAGIFKNAKFIKGNKIIEMVLGAVVAGFMRYCSSVLSGYFVFYSWSSMDSSLLYSIVYNTVILIDAAICAVVGGFLFSSKTMVRQIELINPSAANNDAADER